MIMGFFQVASILELFFVCGSIQYAVKNNNLSHTEPPSVVGIAITYSMASAASIACFVILVYIMVVYDHSNG